MQNEIAVINPNSQSLNQVLFPHPGAEADVHTSSNLRFLNHTTVTAGWDDKKTMRDFGVGELRVCRYLRVQWWSRTGRNRVQYGGSHSWTAQWPGCQWNWTDVQPSDPTRRASLLSRTGIQRGWSVKQINAPKKQNHKNKISSVSLSKMDLRSVSDIFWENSI